MSDIVNSIFYSAIALLFLFIVFRPLETAFPSKKGQRVLRPAWALDLTFFAGQYLLWNGLVVGVLLWFRDALQHSLPNPFQDFIASQPFWLQVLTVIILSDFLVYWGHRLQHNNAFLWRFHKVHHSAEHLDWLAAHREHPLDTLYTVGLINLPAFVAGFPLHTIAGFIAFRGIWAIFIHANVRVPLGPLRIIIGSPDLHHWHHDLDRHLGNYANISPLMDVIFGTYHSSKDPPENFGIREECPNTYLGHMIEPLLDSDSSDSN